MPYFQRVLWREKWGCRPGGTQKDADVAPFQDLLAVAVVVDLSGAVQRDLVLRDHTAL
jgi:hypothetical protein